MSRVDAAVSITKPKPKQKSKADAQWTGAIIELVEFIYGAAELCSFNNGHIFLNELTDSLCEKLGFEVKDCYGAYLEMRRRVGSRTSFLDRMIKVLNEKMDRDDEKEYNRKRK